MMNRQPVQLKKIAFPKEHGSWGLLFEPLVIALAIHFSLSGFFIALGMMSLFFFYNPFRMYVQDKIAGYVLPHTVWVRRFVFLYAGLAAIFFGAGFLTAFAVPSVILFVFALICFLLQFLMTVRREGRSFPAEALGAVGLSFSAPIILLAAGEGGQMAGGVWCLLIARVFGSLIYVRNKLRAHQNRPYSVKDVVLYQVLVSGGLIYFSVLGFIPVLGTAGYLGLAVHSVYGILATSKPTAPSQVGVRELILGILYAVFLIAAYR